MALKTLRVKYQFDARARDYLPLMRVSMRSTTDTMLEGNALLDSGSPFNLLPNVFGRQLGLDWNAAEPYVTLGGGLAGCATRLVTIPVTVAEWEPVELDFAWAENDAARFILGQTDFFQNFRICFYRAELAFDIRPEKVKPHP